MFQFQSSQLKLRDTPLVGKLTASFLNGDVAARPYYKHLPNDASLTSLLDERTKFHVDRNTLVDVLMEQYSELRDSNEKVDDKVLSNIEALRMDNCFTVTTGHQLQVAAGPLFFTYKILSAIHAARHFNSLHAELKIVPVLWLASEDHDIEEISHFTSYGKKYAWDSGGTGAAGRVQLKGLSDTISQFLMDISGKPHTEEVATFLKGVYNDGRSLSLATRILVNRLFGKYGLVILDPDHPALKKKMSNIFREELEKGSSYSLVKKCISTFPESIDVQAMPREINLFYLTPNGRNRIVRDTEKWKILNTTLEFSAAEILEELDKFPERFSPNVILRPLYQEVVLPNLIYSGGPGELAYWMELLPLFECFSVPYPMIMLRNSFLMISHSVAEKMKRLGIKDEMIFDDRDVLLKKCIYATAQGEHTFSEMISALTELYDDMERELSLVDATLSSSVRAEHQKSLKGIEQLQAKWFRAVKRKNDDVLGHFQKVFDHIFPDGVFQERHECLWTYMSKYGIGILDIWLTNAVQYNDQLTILKEMPEKSKS